MLEGEQNVGHVVRGTLGSATTTTKNTVRKNTEVNSRERGNAPNTPALVLLVGCAARRERKQARQRIHVERRQSGEAV